MKMASSTSPKRVVLLGGAFNPVTVGHISKAQMVMDECPDFHELWFLPCYQSVWGKEMAPARDRLHMLHLAVQHSGDSRLFANKFEIAKKLTGPTFDILKKFFARYPSSHYKFHFMIGMDHANIIHTWGNGLNLIQILKFIVIPREGIERDTSITWYMKEPHIFLEKTPEFGEVSSTMARNEVLNKGKTDLVAPSVMDFINRKGLYR